MKVYIAVGLGGIIGTVLRYLISIMFWSEQITTFPWATYTVNISGAFLLTFVMFQPFLKKISPILFVSFTTGLLGAYTTFSTLILEVSTLWDDNASLAFIYLGASIFGGLIASYVGFLTASKHSKGRT